MCEDDRRYIVGFKKEDWSYETDFLGIIKTTAFTKRAIIRHSKSPASADPKGGGDRGSGPPWKITSYMGFYRE